MNEEEKSCSNCVDSKNGMCSGLGKLCREYKAIPTLNKEETKDWPTKCDPERFRDRDAKTGRY